MREDPLCLPPYTTLSGGEQMHQVFSITVHPKHHRTAFLTPSPSQAIPHPPPDAATFSSIWVACSVTLFYALNELDNP